MKKLITIMVFLFALSALAQDAPSLSDDARVGPRDVLDIKVIQDEKLNTRATVGDEGTITMPVIGKVDVNGLSPRQIEQRIKAILEAKALNQADVSVQIVQFGSKPISVVGAVTHPGSISTSGTMSLIQAITEAGGLAPGYGKVLYVLRTAQNGLTEQIAVDIDDLLVNGNPDLNLPLEPRDVVNVPLEVPIAVFLMGEVMHPGRVELRRNQSPSLLQAIAAAGGPTDRAGNKATIKHAGPSGTTQSFNYRRIAEGDAPDIPLQDGDTIYIKESFF